MLIARRVINPYGILSSAPPLREIFGYATVHIGASWGIL